MTLLRQSLPLIALLFAAPGARAAAPSSAAPPPRPSGSKVQEHTLKNGMKVLLLEDHAAPVATFSVFYRVGSRYEHSGNTGSAHLLEHLMFKGTERFKKGEIMGALDRVGARWNATTYYDYTNYFETVPIEKLDFAMGLEADRMQHSLILDQERDLERIVVRNELERGENSPVSALTHDVWAAAFKAHPYHHPVIGWRSDVELVPTSRLREFYKTYYQPDNAVAVVVGDFQAQGALALVEKHFGPIPGGHSFPAPYTSEPPQQGERRVVISKTGDLKVVALAYKAPPAADPDTVALKVLHLVLSGELSLGPFGDPLDPGIGNRLYQGLVDKELATGASIDYTPMKDPSLFLLMATPRPDVEHVKVEEALKAQIDRAKAEFVSAEELSRAKARALAAYGLMQDGTSGRAMLLGYFAAIADWHLADEFAQRVQAVSAPDLQRVARKYLVDDQLTVGWFVPKAPAASSPRTSLREALPKNRPEAFRAADEAVAVSTLSSPRTRGPLEERPSADRFGSIAVAAAAPPIAAPAPPVTRVVVPNGLTVLVRENHASPTVSVSGTVMAGAAFDPPGKPSTASMTADALMRGTRRHSKLEIARLLEEVGATLDYSGGSEQVSVSARALSKDLGRILDLLAETLIEPSFPQDEVEKLKREMVAHLKQAEDSPSTRARRAFYAGLYPKGHPYYVYPLKEAIAAVEGMTPQSLLAFHAEHYGAGSIVLAVVGDVDAREVVAAVQKRLGGMKPQARVKVLVPAVPVRGQPGREVVFVPDKANVDVLLGTQAQIHRTDPSYYPASVANFAFGGAASSRLFQEVRDRLGLTYGIYASLSAAHGAGPWSVGMSLNPSNVDKALEVVRRLSADFARNGVNDAELSAAKETLVGHFKVGLATNSGVASALATFESYGFPEGFIAEHPRRIEAVTREQVLEVVRQSFRPKDALVVIAGSYPPPKPGAARPPPAGTPGATQ
jgi:zinc protease